MTAAGSVWAKGANYEIVIVDGRATIRVWRRPDLSFEAGAALGEEMGGHALSLARGAIRGVQGVVFDLREAPPLMGKRTRAAMAKVAAACETSTVRVAFLAASEAQSTILRLAVGANATHTRVTVDERDAIAWVTSA